MVAIDGCNVGCAKAVLTHVEIPLKHYFILKDSQSPAKMISFRGINDAHADIFRGYAHGDGSAGMILCQ